jgi:hypothetical protein
MLTYHPAHTVLTLNSDSVNTSPLPPELSFDAGQGASKLERIRNVDGQSFADIAPSIISKTYSQIKQLTDTSIGVRAGLKC